MLARSSYLPLLLAAVAAFGYVAGNFVGTVNTAAAYTPHAASLAPSHPVYVNHTPIGTDTVLVDIAAADVATLDKPALFRAVGVRPTDSIEGVDGRSVARAGTDAVWDFPTAPGSLRQLELLRDGAPLRLVIVLH